MTELVVSLPPTEPALRVRLIYEVEARTDLFLLDETEMHESPLHDQILDLLKLSLQAWASRMGRNVLVARNLACRWNPSDPRVGVDPDLCLIEPSPPDLDSLRQLRLWEARHAAPWLGIEVVSEATGMKDYLDAPVRYARLGVRELWVFDPRREGPSETGGPFVLQVWQRQGEDMHRVYAGPGPAWSEALDAWLVVVSGGRLLRLADDAPGKRLWPTDVDVAMQALLQARQRIEIERVGHQQAESARQQSEAAREQAEAGQRAERAVREQAETNHRIERAAREQAEREVYELRRLLAERPGHDPSR